MRTFVYDRPGKVRMGIMPKPSIGRHELLVKVRACGISMSDIIAYVNGVVKSLYHKLVGEIVEVGEKLEDFKVGEHVYFNLYYHCMKCPACVRGHNNVCQNRNYFYDPDIALAEYIKLPSKLIEVGGVIKVPDRVSFEAATHVGPLSNCINTLEEIGVQAGENVVVIGAGYMGLLHLRLLKIHPVNMIIVSEINEYRRKKAEESGADQVINPLKTDITEIKEITNGGADAVIVATANPKAMRQSLEIAGKKGRISFFGGMAMLPTDTSIRLDTSLVHYKELTITGTYSSIVPDQFIPAVELIASKRISVGGLDTHTFSFKQTQEALKLVDEQAGLRAVINL